ncbi:hypothetical protein ACQPVP_08910 [Clostridium nigeriense]|uniref:hypothetical protein n=1 Tax=Clostridium nigeriense TaxID=1805470 RepID=UPI003D3292BE
MDKLTPSEWKERTIRDIKRRQELREKGIKDADSFLAEHRLKTFKNMSKIRCKTYRGK